MGPRRSSKTCTLGSGSSRWRKIFIARARSLDVTARRALINKAEDLPITRQCELLDVARSTAYYQLSPVRERDFEIMARIDQVHLERPFLGSRRLAAELSEDGLVVNRKRVQRLMRIMGIIVIYPEKSTNTPSPNHRIYPYLLRGLTIDRPNQAWGADITYIPMARAFLYLIAVMDWHSRKVLSWKVSNNLDDRFRVEALEEVLEAYGARRSSTLIKAPSSLVHG